MADSKVTALSELTSVGNDDLLYVVDDPGGTPASKKITFGNLSKTATAAISGATTLSWASHGNRVNTATGTGAFNITIPNDTTDTAWPVGGTLRVVNADSADTITLIEDSGLTTVWGTGAGGGRKLASGASATIYKSAANTFVIEGRLTT